MDLTKVFRGRPGKAGVNAVIRYVGGNRERFDKLVTIFLNGPIRVTQYAAWPLSFCVQHHPKLITPHYAQILRAAKTTDSSAVRRNIMRLLQFVDIPKKFQGAAASLAFRFLENRKEAIAVRVFSMTVLANLCTVNPSLTREVIVLIEEGLPYGTAAYASRAKRVLKQLRSSVAKD